MTPLPERHERVRGTGERETVMLRINKNSVFYNASVLTFSGFLLQVAGFAYSIYLSRAAGAEGLGLFRLIMPVHSLSLALMISGVRMAATSLSAEMTLPKDRSSVRMLVRLCVLIFAAAFFLLATPALIFHESIATHLLGDARVAAGLPVMMACIFLTGFELILESLFLGLGYTKYTAVSNLLEQLTLMAAVICMLSFLLPADSGLVALLLCVGMVISEVPVVIWLLWAYRKVVLRAGQPLGAAAPDKKHLLGRIAKIALPVTVGGTVTTLLASAGTVLLPQRLVAAGLNETEALEQLGIISGMAFPLMSFPMLFVSALSNVLLPVISGSFAAGRQNDLRRKVRKAVQAVSLIALPSTAVLLPLAPDLAQLLYGQELSRRYLFLLAVSVVLLDYQIVTTSILNGLRLQKPLLLNVIAGEGIELLLIYLLAATPQLHIYGYIFGTIACGALITGLNLRLIVKHTRAKIGFFKCILLPSLVAVAAGLFSNAIYTVLRAQMSPGGAIPMTLLGALIVSILLLLVIGIRPLRYFRSVFRTHA